MRPRVLVVDDHEDTMLLFVEELRDANFEVSGTTSANEALTVALREKPAVIVTDISMPDIDGRELGRLLRSYAATKNVRLVAVSAHGIDTIKHLQPPGGWDAFAAKPIEPGALASLVRKALASPLGQPVRSGPVMVGEGGDDEDREPPSSRGARGA
jgi:CheY-like chemotaxis protein